MLERRYLAKDRLGRVRETPEELFRRVAHNVALAEEIYGASDAEVKATEERFYALMTSFRFLPNSPTLGNAGRPLQQLAACFVLPVGDSMEGIFDALKHTALIHKSGGGTGFSFSQLRPEGDRVAATGGVASGPVSFMKVFDAATEAIKQGGTRRGANMAILSVYHPDIEAFINAKSDMVTLQNFNISVAVDAEFMDAVERGGRYALLNPRTRKTAGRRDARKVFRAIVENAWKNGDPGLVFLDRINGDNPTPQLGQIEATNPCITGDTWVLTNDGPRQARELVGQQGRLIVNGEPHASGDEGFFSTGVKPVVRVEAEEGWSLRLTGEHRVRRVSRLTRHTMDTEWVAAGDLAPGDRVVLHDHRSLSGWSGQYGEDEGYLIGLLVGDGTLNEDKAILAVWPQAAGAEGIAQAALSAANTMPHRSDFRGWQVLSDGRRRMALGSLKALAFALGMRPRQKTITPALERCSSDFYRGFLRGLFDSDGSVQGSQAKGVSIRLAQSDVECLQAVQRMLLRLGIASRIYRERRPAGLRPMPDGRGGRKLYGTRAQHELIVAGENVARFAEAVGFEDTAKQDRLEAALRSYKRRLNRERFVTTVRSVTPDGEEEVFDVRVPGVNALDASGLYVHNCGEQPLLPYESCNLGSLNLAKFVKPVAGRQDGRRKNGARRNSARKNGRRGASDVEIDWDGLGEVIPQCVRFLDDVIDQNLYPIEAIEQATKATRKIGLGVMGWADLLHELRIPYGSQEAVKLAERMMSFIQKEADRASEALAAERGTFPAWQGSVYAPKRRLRNATRTTVAPTGTLSIIADCSGGIEPVFALAFMRQHHLDPKDPDKVTQLPEVNRAFERVARDEGFYSPELMEELARGASIQDRTEIPEWVRRVYVTSHDVDPEWHVRMQAAFQRHTDNAVSKTINFRASATVEDVERAYLKAYQEGCKGITIYRDQSRAQQVLSHALAKGPEQAEAEAAEQDLGLGAEHPYGPYRRRLPDERPSVTHKFRVGEQEGYITVGLFEDGSPGEVFITISKEGSTIRGLMDSVAVLTSLALQYGVPLEDLAKKFRGVHFEPGGFTDNPELPQATSLVDYVFRWMERRFLTEEQRSQVARMGQGSRVKGHGTEAKKVAPSEAATNEDIGTGLACPECGSVLVFAEGCLTCRSCGFTRCG